MELIHKTGILEGRNGRKPTESTPVACHALLGSNKDLESPGCYRWAPEPLRGAVRVTQQVEARVATSPK